MRVVIDANVAIAALIARGLCDAVIELCLARHDIVLCTEVINEIRTKLLKKIKLPESVVNDFVHMIEENSLLFEPVKVDKKLCRDPDDLMILGLVEPGKVDAIISGDKDLLVIKKFGGAKIMSPREFWDFNSDE